MATSKKKKTCNTCKKCKSLDKFSKDKNAKDGKKARCRECTAIYVNERRADLKAGKISVVRDSNEGHAEFQRAQKLVGGARTRSKKKKIPCTITPADIVPALIRGFCEATGMPFEVDLVEKSNGNNFQHPFAPSIDRIDPELGYESGNIQVVVRGYNMLKGEGSVYQARQIAQALVSLTERKMG
jgi:hypothetical protein